MTEIRYVSDVKNTEKEVRIFDLEDEKKIFNIFFNELDSAICLNGALGDIITRLNEQQETIQQLKQDLEFQKSLTNGMKEECDRFHNLFKNREQQVKDTLQAFTHGIESEKGIDPDNKQFQKSMDCALKYLKRLSEELGIELQ